MHRHTNRAAFRGFVTVRFGLAGMILVALASCASGAATSKPSASSPSVGPSPTPFDVAQAFIRKMTGGKFSAHSTVTGTVQVGTEQGTLDGTYAFAPTGDYHYEITISAPGTRQVTQGTSVAGLIYKQEGYGPWLQSPPGATGGPAPADIGRVLMGIAAVQDVGVEPKAGRQLHHLRPPGGLSIPPSAMGITDPTIIDPQATLELYAEDDGTLAAMTMTMTWTQVTGASTSLDARMVMDFAFSNVGGIVTVSAPSDVWQVFTSKHYPYKVAYPGDWDAPTDSQADYFTASDDSAEMWIMSIPSPKGLTASQWASLSNADVVKQMGTRADGKFAVVISGLHATATEYHGKLNGRQTFRVVVPLMHGGRAYDLQWFAIPGYEQDDIAQLKQFLASFAFTK